MPPPSLCLCVWSFPQCKSRTWYLKERAEWWRHFYAPHFQRSHPSPTLFSKSMVFFLTIQIYIWCFMAVQYMTMQCILLWSFSLDWKIYRLQNSATRRRNTCCVSYREAISLALACFARSTYVEKVQCILRKPATNRSVTIKETKRVWNVELLLTSNKLANIQFRKYHIWKMSESKKKQTSQSVMR